MAAKENDSALTNAPPGWAALPVRSQVAGEKKEAPAPSGGRRCPGDNVGRFLCAKALQQTHMLPANIMRETRGFPGSQTASERQNSFQFREFHLSLLES